MSTFIGLCGKYKINKKLENQIQHCQGVRGKIIEKELQPFVEDKIITGLTLESNIGLHTLRMNLGEWGGVSEDDLVIHMAKEALIAFELPPFSLNEYSRDGMIVAFRKNVHPERRYEDKKYDEFELDLNALEKGISEVIVNSVGKLITSVGSGRISNVFPSWYYEDWVQIHFHNGEEFLIRMDPKSFYGIGIGRTNKSTLYPGLKDDRIFCWEVWSNNIKRYYRDQGMSYVPYHDLNNARVKVKEKDSEV